MVEPGAYYELTELLGEGGMGRVYRAVHHPSGMPVALKLLRSELRGDARRRRLLLDEATVAAKIDHPAIVRLADVGREEDGAPFLVMELARGVPLDAWLSQWPSWPRFASALLDVLAGLGAAHAAGVVHCDLKPPNVIVDPETGRARILDFGVAATLDPLRGAARELIAGTPEFMPPEQLSGEGPIGPWTDLYAFGVILSYAVRGVSPFPECESLTGLFTEKSLRSPDPSPQVRDGLIVPDALQSLIERLVAPRPRARPRFASEVARELAALSREVEEDLAITRKSDSIAPSAVTTVDPAPHDPSARAVSLLDLQAVDATSVVLALPARLPATDEDTALGRLRDTPFVGRDDERLELESLISEVVATGTPRLLAYVGEAGIGKSRLARWGLAFVEREGRMEGAAGGYDASGVDVAGGLRHALKRLLGGAHESAWRWLETDPAFDRAALSSFLQADESHATLSHDRIVQLAHGALRAVARTRPVYLWLDDLGWASDGALALAQRLLDEAESPVLLVATMRSGTAQHPTLRAQLDRILAHPAARVRTLGKLDASARAALLDGVTALAPGIASALADRTEGSPLLLVQLVHDWIDSGRLVATEDGHAPRAGTSVEQLFVERPLRALMVDRVVSFLATLGASARPAENVLVRAALLGARFDHGALRAACAGDAALAGTVDEVLDRALLHGLLRIEREGVYAFDHGLVHEVLVARAEGRRAALLDAANGLQSRYGKDRADIAALVAGLLRRAGDRERAWERQVSAIERAAWVNDAAAAQAYLGVARAWANEEPAQDARVTLLESRAHYFALRYDAALESLVRARALASRSGDDLLVARCDIAEADIAFYQDRFGDAERIARRVVDAASFDDPDLASLGAAATQRLAEVAVLRADLEESESWRVRSLAYAEATNARWRIRVTRLNLAEITAARGRWEEAQAMIASTLAEARAARDDDNVVAALETQARAWALAGDVADARPFLTARMTELSASGDAWRMSGLAPFAALAIPDDEPDALELAAARAVRAFAAVPHDEALTLAALRALAARLSDRGALGLARDIDALLEAREAVYGEGFARTTEPGASTP